MKIISLLVIGCFAFSLLASPCDDSLFVELQNKDEETMSQTELFYVREKRAQCDAFNDSLETAQRDSVEQIARDHKWKTTTKPLIITGIVCGVIGTVVLFAIALNNDNMFVEVGGQRID
ncbi:MAG: hypothetical protein GF418_17515 [Chitinivibrionales bacterium]|nr:hypothetical protein [Chitinivibrionales bacterium]MBD3397420.1 hypothetical protein [Chitinivibrionales bacterium]